MEAPPVLPKGDLWPYSVQSTWRTMRLMSSLSAEILLTVAVLILVAVAAGTLAARLFTEASRPHGAVRGSEKDA